MEHFEPISKFLLGIRGFNPEEYIQDKVKAINTFFRENKLDSCVIGISGGVDSAVVYKLLLLASQTNGSPIKLVKGACMPIQCSGTTGQVKGLDMALLLVDKPEDLHVNFLGSICDDYAANLCASGRYDNIVSDVEPSPWTVGQIASIVRTPMLYGHAAYLQQLGYKSIVVGTTNRDEGSYIGFFGKASDAMVDLQPIADIHKTEVYAIAKLLGVPEEIINRQPTGDVFDASLDEDTIGAPYWFIQLYLLFLENEKNPRIWHYIETFTGGEYDLWQKYSQNITAIHNKNKHKYEVGFPSRFIDVMPRKIPNGWN